MSHEKNFLEVAQSQAFLDALCEIFHRNKYKEAVGDALANHDLDPAASNFTFWKQGRTCISQNLAEIIIDGVNSYVGQEDNFSEYANLSNKIVITEKDVNRLRKIANGTYLGKGEISEKANSVAKALYESLPKQFQIKSTQRSIYPEDKKERQKVISEELVKKASPIKAHILKSSIENGHDSDESLQPLLTKEARILGDLLILTSNAAMESSDHEENQSNID